MAEFVVRSADHLPGLIEAFRKQAGLTQAGLALRMGITQQSLSRLERSADSMSTARLANLLSILGVEMVLRDRDFTKTSLW